jgi:hypothetical protein
LPLDQIFVVAQILAAVAVIATLGYLAAQTRQQARISRSEMYMSISDGWGRIAADMRRDPEFTRLLRVALRSWTEISKNQQVRVHGFLTDLIVHLDAVLTLRAQELIDEDLSHPWVDNSLGVILTPGGAEWWAETNFYFTPQVRDELDRRLGAPDTLPPAWTHFPAWIADDVDIERVTASVSS